MADREDVDFEDYYDLLGVSPSASRTEIRAAYEDMVMDHHPDRSHSSPDNPHADSQNPAASAELFKHLQRARDILCTPHRRENYDQVGHDQYLREQFSDDPLTTRSADTEAPETASATDGSTAEQVTTATTPERDATAQYDRPPEQASPATHPDDPSLDKLVSTDPLEDAWAGWRRQWTLRLIAGVFATMGTVLLFQTGAASGLRKLVVPVGLAVSIIGATAGYAHVSYPVRADPGTPPAGASIGLFRPARVRSLVRRAATFGVLAIALTLTGMLSAPHPWPVFHRLLGTGTVDVAWPVRTLVEGGQALVVTAALLVVLALTTVLAAMYGLVGLSAGAWSAFFSGRSRVSPLLWEGGATVALVTLGVGLHAGAQPLGISLPSLGGFLATTNGQATGSSLIFLGLLLLVVLEGAFLLWPAST